MRREATGLAVLSACVLVGCVTPKIEYEPGTAPYTFDCDAHPGYYQEFNIHASNGKLRLAGFIALESVAARPDPYWNTQAKVSLLGLNEAPFVELYGYVRPESADRVYFSLRYGLKSSDVVAILPEKTTPVFAERGVGDPPIAFEITMNESRQLTASVGGAAKTVPAPQFDVIRARFTCSGTHTRFSYVTVTAE
jgi:hypothetical protein